MVGRNSGRAPREDNQGSSTVRLRSRSLPRYSAQDIKEKYKKGKEDDEHGGAAREENNELKEKVTALSEEINNLKEEIRKMRRDFKMLMAVQEEK